MQWVEGGGEITEVVIYPLELQHENNIPNTKDPYSMIY